MDAKSAFAKRLRSIIRGTQKAFASRAGVTEQNLSAYLYGKAAPQWRTGDRLAAAAEPPVNVEWLMDGEGPERGARIPILGRATATGVGLAAEATGDEDLITQRIEALEAVGLSGQTGREEIAIELLLLTAQRVRVLEREVAELVRAHREGHPPVEKTEG